MFERKASGSYGQIIACAAGALSRRECEALFLKGASKNFDGVTAVENVTLSIYREEFFSCLGDLVVAKQLFCAYWLGLKPHKWTNLH